MCHILLNGVRKEGIKMNLREKMAMRTAATPVVGEIYEIKGLNVFETDDKFNKGAKRLNLVLDTDKGAIYAPSPLTRAYITQCEETSADDAAALIVGSRVRCTEYESKTYGRRCKDLEFID